MPQEQRIRDTRRYPGDAEGSRWGYAPYTGKVGYCNQCQNYNDDTAEGCEICGGEVRRLSVSHASEQPEIKGVKSYSFANQEAQARQNQKLDDVYKYRGLSEQLKARNFSAYYLKPVAHHRSEHLRQMVFVPAARGDDLTTTLSHRLASKGELHLHGDARGHHGDTSLHRVAQPVLHPRSYQLHALREGGRLYLVGHGNAGGAMGDHDDKYGATSLVKLLLAERLPKEPRYPVTLWLFACATGAAVNLGYVPIPFYRKDPFVQRMAKALWASGCSNYYVVGFAGFVGTEADICVDYSVDDDQEDARQWRLTSTEERIVYQVTGEGASKVHGGDFIQQTDFRWLGNPKKWNWKNTQLQVSAKGS